MAEPPIGGGPDLKGGGNRGGKNRDPMATIAAQVKVDGLRSLEQVLSQIAKHSKEIRSNFDAINKIGQKGGFWSKLGLGGGSGGNNSLDWLNPAAATAAGAPAAGQQSANSMNQWLPQAKQAAAPAAAPAGGGGGDETPATGAAATPSGRGSGGNTMPWMSRTGFMLSAATAGAQMLSGRIGRNLAESAPISSQMALFSSMYSGMPYGGQEMQRYSDIGRYGGSRQEVAQTQALSLRYGQTPQQASNFMSGIGNMVQAFGGTMSSSQAAASAGGFLDPMVLRRQIASGMTPARVGGQVRNPMEVAQEYIKNYEDRRNRGVKLNEFDFINLQTPGSAIRYTFSRLYGLDDESLDLLATAGMQTIRAGGSLNYNSSASIASGLGMDRSKLGLATTSLATTSGKREASFMNQNEGGMVTQVRIEEDVQEALTGLEDAASGLTSTFAALDKAIKVATTGFGLLFGAGMLGGLGGGMGGGLLGKLGLGGMGAAGQGVGNAGVATAANLGGQQAGGGGGGMGFGGKAMIGATGAVLAGQGLLGASQSRTWGGVLGNAAQATAGGAMLGGSIFGLPGAIGGGIIAGGSSLLLGAFGITAGENEEDVAAASTTAGNLTDKEILDKIMTMGPDAGNAPTGLEWDKEEGTLDLEQEGMYDRFMQRRSALVSQFMEEARTSDPVGFDKFMRYYATASSQDFGEALQEWADTSFGFQTLQGDAKINDPDYINWAKKFEYMSRFMRQGTHKGKYDSYDHMHELFLYYFGNVDNPMSLDPKYTEPAYDIIDQYSWTATDMASPTMAAAASGDPIDDDGSTTSTSNSYAYIDRMPMAKPPNDKSWTGLDARMKKRLLALFAASNGTVSLGGGGGTRTEAQQRAMFLSRYTPSPNGTIEWEGKKWKHTSGAAAAPPGRSMHEIGLAADLQGPGVGNGWLKKNAAKFGLKEFSNVNSEPWHVQPAELPNSRREYEGGDYGEWGTGAGEDESTNVEGGSDGGGMGGGGTNLATSGLGGSSGSALSLGSSSLSVLQGGGGGGGVSSYTGTGGATSGDQTQEVDYSGSGPLTGKQVAQMLYNQGFRGDNLVMAVAISKRESNWDPAAFNGNSGTGDKSYGLFQINMIGDLGPSRRQSYGLEKNEELLDPKTNIRVAWEMSQHGQDFDPWGGYKGMADNYNTDMDSARQIVTSMNLGDAAFDTGTVGTGGLSLPTGGVGRSITSRITPGGGTGTLNLNVTITSTGNYAYDAKKLAQAARPALEAEYADVTAKRSQ